MDQIGNFIGRVEFYWANPNMRQQDEGNIPVVIFNKLFISKQEALEGVRNKAKQQSIAILKSKWNKHKQLPICRYFVKIENSWVVAEGKAKQGVIYDEWEEKEL